MRYGSADIRRKRRVVGVSPACGRIIGRLERKYAGSP